MMLASPAAFAAEPVRKQACPKIESPRQQLTPQQQQQLQRQRASECRAAKPVPPLFDPTPTFLL